MQHENFDRIFGVDRGQPWPARYRKAAELVRVLDAPKSVWGFGTGKTLSDIVAEHGLVIADSFSIDREHAPTRTWDFAGWLYYLSESDGADPFCAVRLWDSPAFEKPPRAQLLLIAPA